jgi:hypothetical protein
MSDGFPNQQSQSQTMRHATDKINFNELGSFDRLKVSR